MAGLKKDKGEGCLRGSHNSSGAAADWDTNERAPSYVPRRTYRAVQEGHAASTHLMAKCQIMIVNKRNLVPHGTVPDGSVELVNKIR